jgi:hypothetical protein
MRLEDEGRNDAVNGIVFRIAIPNVECVASGNEIG